MKYEHLSAFEKHLREAPPFYPLYFFLVKDEFACEEAVRLLLSVLLPEKSSGERALSVLDGSQVGEEEFWERLNSLSLLSESQVLWIKQADKLKKSIQEKPEDYFTRPSLSVRLIMSAPSWVKTSSFYKASEKIGAIVEIPELKPREKESLLVERINRQIRAEGKTISFQACQELIGQIGSDSRLLSNEIDKLICYCSEKNEITLSDIREICVTGTTVTIWQLGEALFRRDTIAALQAARASLLESRALLPLLRQIRSQFQTGYQVSLLSEGGKRPEAITEEFPYMKGRILDQNVQRARRYGQESFKRGLLAIDATEIRLKNSNADEDLLLELLVMQLTAI